MVSIIKSRLKDRKFLMRLFCFLSAFIVVFWLGAVTAFAADESASTSRYAELSDEPKDGEGKWPWPFDGIYNSFREAAYNLIMSSLEGSFDMIDGVTDTANETLQKTPKEYQSSIFGTVDTVAKKVIMPILNIVSIVMFMCVYIIMIGRMIEIYLHLSVAPIPLATITNREFGESGKNYLKIIFAFVLQMFFILLGICIYRTLVVKNLSDTIGSINVGTDNVAWIINLKLFEILAYGAVLILTMFKSNSLAKSILGAH